MSSNAVVLTWFLLLLLTVCANNKIFILIFSFKFCKRLCVSVQELSNSCY